MTTLTSRKSNRVSLACLAAMTVILGVAAVSLTSQFGSFGAAFANDATLQSSPRGNEGIGSTAASRVVPCQMPAAWRKHCSL